MEKEQIKGPDRGLGDTIARFTSVTRINKLAERIAKTVGAKNCGCTERQHLLNEMFPYKNSQISQENSQENNQTT